MRTLKDQHREIRDRQSEALAIRLHRAISWLTRSQQNEADDDTRFIHLWIAFNAAYAGEFKEGTEQDRSARFIKRLIAIDQEQQIHQLLLTRFSGSVRLLVDNKYLFSPFWAAMRNHDASGVWKKRFNQSRQHAMDAVLAGNTERLMAVVLERLHMLRNQLIHGGATWNGAVNRIQVKEAADLMAALVPTIIALMMKSDEFEHDAVDWPVVPDISLEDVPVAGGDG